MNISELLKLWRVEKGSSQLSQIPPSFYSDAKKLTEISNPYEAKKAKDLYLDIVHMRQHKMLMACLRHLQGGDKPQNMLAIEKKTYDKIFEELQAARLGALPQDAEVVLQRGSEKGGLSGQAEAETGGAEVRETISEKPGHGAVEDERVVESYVCETRKLNGFEGDEPEMEVAGEGRKGKRPEKAVDGETLESEGDSDSMLGAMPARKTSADTRAAAAQTAPKKGGGGTTVFKDETENKTLKRVRFLRPIPAFVGPDLESIGPFEEDQEVELDAEVAEILLKNDAVELI